MSIMLPGGWVPKQCEFHHCRDVFVFLPMGSRKSLCNSILTYTFKSPKRTSQAESIQMTPNRLAGAILMPDAD